MSMELHRFMTAEQAPLEWGEDWKELDSAGPSRMMRISAHPVETDDELIVDDRLEEEGSIRLFEYIGGALYMPLGLSGKQNAVPVAGAEIAENGTGGLKVKKMFHEYGYGGVVPLIVDQILHFADFYGYDGVEFLDLRKNDRKAAGA